MKLTTAATLMRRAGDQRLIVEDRLRSAAATLRRIRLGPNDRPGGFKAAWPGIVRDAIEAYGYDKVRCSEGIPPPAEITAAEEAIGWLMWLDEEARKIVWARALRIPWRRIEDRLELSVATLRRRYDDSLDLIVGRLHRPVRKTLIDKVHQIG